MSFRYPAGLITASSPVNANYPSGVWTPRQALPYLQNGVWGQDQFFDQTVLLLHGDGTNGAQNNTFLDSSSNNFTITRNGNTTQGTFTPFSLAAGEWSNYFDGTGDYLSFTGSSTLQFGTGDWTVEFWVYMSSLPTQSTILDLRGSASAIPVVFNVFSTKFSFYNGSAIDTSGITPVANTWYHVAYVKSSGTTNIYVNGTSYASVADSVNYNTGTGTIMIGRGQDAAAYYLTGYISNLRVVKGTAVYTAAFTPPTAPLTAITNTSLLTCQSNRFVDNSTNAFAITANGDVKVTPFSPFAPAAAYSAGTNGGSGYFDGTGDYLSVADNAAFTLGSGDWTLEFLCYPTSTARQILYAQTNSSATNASSSFFTEISSTSKWRFFVGSGETSYEISSSANIVINAWTHLAFVRNGNTATLYVNGSSVGTVSLTGVTVNDSSQPVNIGSYGNTGSLPFSGYISNLRLVVGSAVYTSAFTPPTAPLTAITNTQLLCNFTNAGIIDNTGKNNLETVGNAQIDTTTKKYGTGSLEFDGTGDSLVTVFNPNFVFGTGDFTVEYWYKSTATAASILHPSTTGSGYWSNFINTSTFWWQSSNQTTNLKSTSATSIIDGNWHHVAVVRASGTMNFYFDGTVQGSGTADTTNYSGSAGTLRIGASGGYISDLNGFIDDLRITKGIARYTANFVPPVARFPNQ